MLLSLPSFCALLRSCTRYEGRCYGTVSPAGSYGVCTTLFSFVHFEVARLYSWCPLCFPYTATYPSPLVDVRTQCIVHSSYLSHSGSLAFVRYRSSSWSTFDCWAHLRCSDRCVTFLLRVSFIVTHCTTTRPYCFCYFFSFFAASLGVYSSCGSQLSVVSFFLQFYFFGGKMSNGRRLVDEYWYSV